MDHSAYERIIPGSHTAVLMVHGIMGTPRHFDMLLPLIPESWSVYNVLLPGHGGSTLEFGRSSMAKWRGYSLERFRELCGQYRRVILVGHSMGTLFGIRMALERPEKVPFLFFLASPMAVGLKPVMVENALRVAFGTVREEDPRQTASRDACSVETTLRLWEYLSWIPRYLELFRESAAARREIARLNVPTIAFMAKKDEQVSLRSVKEMAGNPAIEVRYMPDSSHHVFAPGDKAAVMAALRAMLQDT